MQGPIFPTIISQANVDSINDNSINSLTSVQLSIITITTITTVSLQKTKQTARLIKLFNKVGCCSFRIKVAASSVSTPPTPIC